MNKKSLSRSIFVFIYSLVFCLSIAFFVPGYIQQQRYIKAEFLERAKSLTRNLALNAQVVMQNSDKSSLYIMTDTLMRENDILWVLVLDKNKQVVAENGTVDFSGFIGKIKGIEVTDKTAIKTIEMADGKQAYNISIGLRGIEKSSDTAMVNEELGILEGFGAAQEKSSAFQGSVHVGMSKARLQAVQSETGLQSFIILLVALGISTVAGFYFAKLLLTPIHQFIARLKDIASRKGDLTQRLNLDRDDEFGEMAHYFNQFMDSIFHIIKGTIKLVAKINTSLEEISSTAEELNANADGVNQTVQGVTNDLAKQEQVSTETNNTIEEVLNTILTITQKSQEAYEVSAETESISRASSSEVEGTITSINSISDKMNLIEERMQRLNKAVSGIGELLDAIRNIASQTNLLSLNAAIEAARAGEAGRGFSVVAEEVRKLAEDSSSASSKIQDLIGKIQIEIDGTNEATQKGIEVVKHGSKMVDSAGKALEKIMKSAEHSAVVTEQISASLVMQTQSLKSMINKVEDVKSLVKNNFEAAQSVAASIEEQAGSFEQITSAIQELSEDAQNTRKLIVEFKIN